MIKKYIENTEEIRQRLTQMLMEDAREMCRYQRDIYMYIDEDGQARLEWFENPGGKSWIDDDHILLYRCRQHYEGIEGIEGSIDGTAMLAAILDITDAELADAVSLDYGIDREDLDADDCFRWAFSHFCDRLREWYDECIEDAASDYADQSDEIMRGENRFALEHGYMIEEHTGRTAVVWLFVIDADDQLDHLKHDLYYLDNEGGDSNGRE